MTLLSNPIPHRPRVFLPGDVPAGVHKDIYAYRATWLASRPTIKPRVIVVHTNGGGGEGNYTGAINWSNGGDSRTHAHYNLNAPTPSKSMSTALRSIANSTASSIEQKYGLPDSSFWSISIETADRGYNNGGGVDLGDFLYDHDELLARIIAYESIVWDIPIVVPEKFGDPGVVCHTEPFPYPYFTTVSGKTCPGTTKKDRVLRGDILPRARQIRAAWLGEPPTEGEEDMPKYVNRRNSDTRKFGPVKSGTYKFAISPQYAPATAQMAVLTFTAKGNGHIAVRRIGDEEANTAVVNTSGGWENGSQMVALESEPMAWGDVDAAHFEVVVENAGSQAMDFVVDVQGYWG